MDLTQLLEQDEENGVIRFRQTGIRANILSSQAWASMKTRMFQSFGSGAASILFGLGQFYGSEALGTFTKSNGQKAFNIFQFAVVFGRSTGWGKITPTFSTETLRITVENCCFCEGMKLKDPVCYEFAGIISEGLSSIASEHIPVKETSCIGKGDQLCKFEVSITPKLREHLRSS